MRRVGVDYFFLISLRNADNLFKIKEILLCTVVKCLIILR